MVKFVEKGTASVSKQGEVETSEFNGDSWANPDTSNNVATDSQGRLRLAEAGGIIIDDFEDGNIDEYFGTTSDFFVDKAPPVFEGDYSMKTRDNANRAIVSYPSDPSPLDNYPTRGDRIRYYYYPTNSESAGGAVVFAESGTSYGSDLRGYLFEVNAASADSFRIVDAANFNEFTTGGQTPSTGVWYEVNVYSNSSQIRATFENLSTNVIEADLSISDTRYSGSGFGWKKRDSDVFDEATYRQNIGLPP